MRRGRGRKRAGERGEGEGAAVGKGRKRKECGAWPHPLGKPDSTGHISPGNRSSLQGQSRNGVAEGMGGPAARNLPGVWELPADQLPSQSPGSAPECLPERHPVAGGQFLPPTPQASGRARPLGKDPPVRPGPCAPGWRCHSPTGRPTCSGSWRIQDPPVLSAPLPSDCSGAGGRASSPRTLLPPGRAAATCPATRLRVPSGPAAREGLWRDGPAHRRVLVRYSGRRGADGAGAAPGPQAGDPGPHAGGGRTAQAPLLLRRRLPRGGRRGPGLWASAPRRARRSRHGRSPIPGCPSPEGPAPGTGAPAPRPPAPRRPEGLPAGPPGLPAP